ncbi:MAG: hypothetical protein B6243_09360 [Anaerolineaceae bacterium 4572_5.2]|nr:MAG: hypothetical protein B6243_09360 [Anaerolineaceae bacterium 4572_5.2]
MPIYTYRCENCGIQFDQEQRFNDPSLTKCPECEKKSLHRVYKPVGIVFKGSGFYATDNRKSSGQKTRKAKGGVSKETKSKESKPEKSKSAQKESKSEKKK